MGEAFPTKRETAQVVAKKLIEDILLRFGFPAQVGSDNGPAFVSQVSQGVARALGVGGSYIVLIGPRAQDK